LGAPAGDIAMKQQIAYLPEEPYFYEHLTAREVVRFYAQLFGMDGKSATRRADELLDLVGLKADSSKTVRQFSKGMKQRVGIAQSLINNPKLLFYDEPTSGLDPISHRDIRDLILHLKQQGKTIFLSSHQLTDVEMVCDRVSIMDRGVLKKLGRVDELVSGGQVEIVASNVQNGLRETWPRLRPNMTRWAAPTSSPARTTPWLPTFWTPFGLAGATSFRSPPSAARWKTFSSKP
jgi:ABC-2 type transport system ATP-binding protein